MLRHYTWQQEITPSPYVAMSFNRPLKEIFNITMHFYREGRLDIRQPSITMCFSTSLDFDSCNDIELPQLPRPSNGVVVLSMTLPRNITSVRHLRIDMEYDREIWIFLSEIRVSERLRGTAICCEC